jgi:hypothetical protein
MSLEALRDEVVSRGLVDTQHDSHHAVCLVRAWAKCTFRAIHLGSSSTQNSYN